MATKHTMIRAIWLGGGIRMCMLACTDAELRAVLDQVDSYIAIGYHRKPIKAELEEWRLIVLQEIQRRQIEAQIDAGLWDASRLRRERRRSA